MLYGLALIGCGNEMVAAEVDLAIAPVDGDVGAFVDLVVPMRLELYGPELDEGIEWRPYFGFIQTPVDAQVACMDEVVLDASTSNDQLAVFFTREVNDFDDSVRGGNFVEGGWSSRQRGEAVDVLDLRFPCLPDPISHDVHLTWTVDRTSPVPYTDVP